MRFQSKILFSVFCLVLMSFVFMSSEDTAYAQTDWCCNNNAPDPQDGFCVPSPQMEQNCNGTNQTFFEDGIDGITLAPVCVGPQCPTSGDLCPNPAPLREACMCLDNLGNTVPCQDLPPPPTDPPPTDPPPTDPPPTDPPPTDPPPTDPPPTDPPPTDPPPTDPPPTDPPPTDPPPTDPPPTDPPPTPTPPPFTTNGCCVEDPGVCHITESANACPVPPYFEYVANVSSCENVAACDLPPPVTSVPTMNQWGLIATAVMLGLFSLITVRRGFRINNKENN